MKSKITRAYELAVSLMNEYGNWNTAIAEVKNEYNLSDDEIRTINAIAETD